MLYLNGIWKFGSGDLEKDLNWRCRFGCCEANISYKMVPGGQAESEECNRKAEDGGLGGT